MSKLQICVILDQSSSMESVRGATISGFNEFLADQKRSGVESLITLTKFNTECQRVYTGKPVAEADELSMSSYVPEGSTALHDAVFKTIRDIEKLVTDEKVLVCILTDGEENSSRECSLTEVKALIQEKEATGRWTFTYLGANQDAWIVGQKMGIHAGNVAAYAGTPTGTMAAMRSMSLNTTKYAQSDGLNATCFYGDGSGSKVEDPGNPNPGPRGPVFTPPVVEVPKGQPTWRKSR